MSLQFCLCIGKALLMKLIEQKLCEPCGNEIVVASFLQHFDISKAAVGLKLIYHSLISAKSKQAKLQFFSLSGSQV